MSSGEVSCMLLNVCGKITGIVFFQTVLRTELQLTKKEIEFWRIHEQK